MARHVADDEAEALVAEIDHVVPVASNRGLVRGRQVTRRHPQAGNLGQLPWQQAALERRRDPPLDHQPRPLDRERDAVGNQLEQLDVALVELSLRERAHVEDSDHLALDQQGNAQQGAELLLAEERVDGLYQRVLEVLDHDRLAGEGDAASEATADRQAEAALDFLLEPLGGPGGEGPAALLDEKDRRSVGIEHVRDPVQQLLEQIVEVQVRERRLGDLLDILDANDLIGRRRHPLLLVGSLRRHLPDPDSKVRRSATAGPPRGLLGGDARIRLDLLRDDHQEVRLGVTYEALDAVRLVALLGGPELIRVVTDQVLEIELALRVELLEFHLGALTEPPLDGLPIDVQLVVRPDVDATTGHPGAGPGPDVAEDHGATRGHVLEGEALRVGTVDHAAPGVVHGMLGLAGEDDVGAREADAEA